MDPVLSNLTDNATPSWVHFNWGVIGRELKKFGCELISKVKEAIVAGHHEIIREVIRFLMDHERTCIKERRKYDRQVRKGMTPEIVYVYPPPG